MIGERELERAATLASTGSDNKVQFDSARRLSAGLIAARYRLANGLTIVLMPDFRAPVFAYQSWFRVGSKHEDPERTGLAHLFEHLMFKGTKNHPAGELDREMERRGSQTNAGTWVDWTYYHEALAARDDNLETVVAFEADRMANLVLDADTFASELEVVKNERRMAIEDSVTGSLSESLYRLAFREHAYRWPTIGSMAHLSAASLVELERFYRTYYAPNNATLVVAGAIEPAPTLQLLARHYGVLQAQELPSVCKRREPEQREVRLAHIERPLAAPQLVVGFHAPAQIDSDYEAVEMLGDVLVAGDSARLYRRLVTEEQLASEVDGALMPFAEPGLYEIFITVQSGVDPAHVVSVVQEELDRLSSGLAPAELDKARNSLELGFLDSWKHVEGAAEALGHWQTNYDDYALAAAFPERLARVTENDLARVAAQVFRRENRSTVIASAFGNHEAGR